jgi:hypothetical protein
VKKDKQQPRELKYYSVRRESQNVAVEHFFSAYSAEEALEKFNSAYLKFFYEDLDIKTKITQLEQKPKLYDYLAK